MDASNVGRPQPLVGDAGKESIKHAMSMGNPQQAIADYRAANSLDLPAADAVYALLDSMGVTRHSVHSTALVAASSAAINHIQNNPLSNDKHMTLLEHIRHYMDFPQLQQLPLQLLDIQPRMIPFDICEKICKSPRLYESCSTNIKRVLWQQNTDLFRQHMFPLIQSYADSEDLLWMSREMTTNAVMKFTSRRRKNKSLLDISAAIGADLRLYMQTLGMIRELFLETNNPAFGTLRLDLVMLMHENDVSDIIGDDICHGLAWPLDACITKQLMDDRRVQELQSYFDRFNNENMPYGEISLILSSPYSRHVLAQYVLSILEAIAPESAVSQRYKELKFPRVLLTMGLSAQELIQQDHPKIPKDSRLKTREFFQSLLVHIEDTAAQPVPEATSILTINGIARQVLYTFVLKLAANQNMDALNTWLSVIGDFLHSALGISSETPPYQISLDAQTESRIPQAIPVSHNIDAFELDAFIQSIVSCICSNHRATATILNDMCLDLDLRSDVDGGTMEPIKLPLVKLLDQVGRLRHCGHEQMIAFLTGCASFISAEYGVDSASSPQTTIEAKENAVYCVYKLCEHAAANYVVDPAHIDVLKEQYNKLSLACPSQAFKYQIVSSNCPNASKFLLQ
ncbi:hypothetical protein IW139_001062 [Coemansia sp. RSA 353]|nr:hypothetical protein LPJ69_000103 [Coemansia sp. RSA 1752]KAJ1795262.1 hypothetical protein LPJ67_000117 [Coemansia sp. RSA 1938]KAJ2139074.1 hypothetical protein GGH17_000757 [Coemansia sp. RSA 788]KAJ2167783.1 hypothetical protein GGH15_001878 [Coemansia sp. RSA 562]KAJ2198954.1 hypothetical protein GGH18_000783 [Coemansia sp. RSA 530]KAJ2207982.1 hypothetical protein IW145_001074 [Coemansia sp. RSA 521]KAJ2256325.1 hypothetical protein GGH98_001571 [Coemansia sp. RSA 454]KAJ2283034.1 h